MPFSMLRILDVFCASPVFVSLSYAMPQNGQTCKAQPGTPSWPSREQWASLNTTIDSQLLAPLPPAAVCDSSLAVFDNASCTAVAAQWTTSDFHAKDPVSIDQPNWQDNACFPVPGIHCNLLEFPRYVINATKPAHVKAGIDFARAHRVRLIVKGTGHDYLGRSTAPNSLSVWTHNLRGIQWQSDFVPTGCSAASSSALKVAAGHRMFELYDAAAAHGSMIVGGEDPDVGLVGHLTGGGHSPISGTYGLAADNVLELEVVTPAGDIKTVNQCTNIDLFFASRGGGGSTFGVILSATIKTHPMPSMTWSHFDIIQTSPTREPFWQAMAYYQSQLPHLVQSGLMGYYNISSVSPFEPSTPLILGAGVWILNTSVSDFNAIVDPVLNHIQATYPVKVTRSARYEPSFYDWWKVYSPAGAVATESQLGNRLMDERALSQPLDTIASSLADAYQNLVLISNLVSGPGMWNANPPGGLGLMTPAWRKTVVEIIVPVIWPAHNSSAKGHQTDLLTHEYMAALRRLAPDTGTYLNEADVNEPDLPGVGFESVGLGRMGKEWVAWEGARRDGGKRCDTSSVHHTYVRP